MPGPDTESAVHELAFEAHGVRVAVRTSDAELLARVAARLPPGSRPWPVDTVAHHFALLTEDGAGYRIVSGDETVETCLDQDLAIGMLDTLLRMHVAFRTKGRFFVHAGVVGHQGRGIVIPGSSFSGKTTLVAALVRAGAVYYSDEYAVLDDRGLVHALVKPLGIRDADGDGPCTVESLGGRSGIDPLPIGLIAVTTYRPGAEWNPRTLSPGEGMLALLAHALSGHERPAQPLAVTRRAVADAIRLEGERGEAAVAAAALLEAAGKVTSGRVRGPGKSSRRLTP
jgi:hypothetical protein